MKKILKFFCVGSIGILISAMVLIVFQKPLYHGEVQIFGRSLHPISIYRDEYGVPTIKSKTEIDVYYGLGYA